MFELKKGAAECVSVGLLKSRLQNGNWGKKIERLHVKYLQQKREVCDPLAIPAAWKLVLKLERLVTVMAAPKNKIQKKKKTSYTVKLMLKQCQQANSHRVFCLGRKEILQQTHAEVIQLLIQKKKKKK